MLTAYTHGASKIPLLGQTIGENLRQTVEHYPQREALIVPHQNYRANYAEFWEQTGAVAKGLLASGIQQGDRVGIWAPNRFEWVVLQYATARVGAILVNINPAYRAHELAYVLQQAEVGMLVLAHRVKTSNYVEMLAQIRDQCPLLTQTVVLDDDWQKLISSGIAISDQALTERESRLQFDDPVNLQYTSGTTGFPKGATLSHHNLLNNGYFIGRRLNYTEQDKVCIPVPFYHCFGMVIGNLACTTSGACMVIPSESFEPAASLRAVQQERCTSLYGVPTMFIAELALPDFDDYDLSSLRTGVMAGSPCPIEVMKQVQTRMHMSEVSICYGMTETSPVSTQTRVDCALEKRVTTVGEVQDHLEIKLVDPETGQIVGRGQPGELCTRGYSVMLGYWNNPTATAQAIDSSGWMHTGDLAVMDEEGYLNIVGRIKDMIMRGGENIYPRELEEFLYTHPAVSDVQVIGVPSLRYGEEVMAWIKLREGAEADAESLKSFCQENIARYKIPSYWKFVEGFPMTVTGKIRKVEMREMAIRELGLEQANSVETA